MSAAYFAISVSYSVTDDSRTISFIKCSMTAHRCTCGCDWRWILENQNGECKQLTPDHIHRHHTGFGISSLQLLDSVILESSFVNCADNNGHVLILSFYVHCSVLKMVISHIKDLLFHYYNSYDFLDTSLS